MESLSGGRSLEGDRFLPHLPGNINELRKPQTGAPAVSSMAHLTPESLADLCLGHLAEDPPQLADFMTTTGYSPGGLRAAVGGEQLGRGLIDYFAQNEPLMLALCANNALRPEDFMRVWARLNPSGQL
jgi:hypothetical protein